MAQVLGDGQLAVNARMLEDDAEAATEREGVAAEVETRIASVARLERNQGREQNEERGLAAAVGTEQAEDLAARDRKAYVAQSLTLAVTETQVRDFNRIGCLSGLGANSRRRAGDGYLAHVGVSVDYRAPTTREQTGRVAVSEPASYIVNTDCIPCSQPFAKCADGRPR